MKKKIRISSQQDNPKKSSLLAEDSESTDLDDLDDFFASSDSDDISSSTSSFVSSTSSESDCPPCDPDDENCGCGERPDGAWYNSNQPQTLSTRSWQNQNIACGDLQCTGRIRISIRGMRIFHESVGTSYDACTCLFYTTFQIVFRYDNITCPGGSPCEDFETYLNGGDLWPGRWIFSGACLAKYADYYLDNCVTSPTHAGFNMTNFLSMMNSVRPDCNGTMQHEECPNSRPCPDPTGCP